MLATDDTRGARMDEAEAIQLSGGFESFHRTNRDRLVATLTLHLGDVHLAADAVDHAMTVAWDRWERLDDRADAGGWVYRVALNWATSWLRRLRFRSRRELPDRAGPPDTPDLGGDPALRDALHALSGDHRAVVVLRLLHGMSTRETATALDVPAGTVKSRLARALDHLRDALDEQASS